MNDNSFFNYLTGGAIKTNNVLLFFLVVMSTQAIVAIVDWIRGRFRGLPSMSFVLREILVFYVIVVLITNAFHLSIWFAVAVDMGCVIVLILSAALFNSRRIGIEAVRSGMLTGAFLVFLVSKNLSLIINLPLTLIAYCYVFNVLTHFLHNLIVPSLLEKINRGAALSDSDGFSPAQDERGVIKSGINNQAGSTQELSNRTLPRCDDITFEFYLLIDAPCQEVFDFLTDLAQSSRVVGAPAAKIASNSPIGLGTKWASSHHGGITECTVVVYDSPRMLARQFSGSLTGIIEDLFQPIGEKTRVTRRVNVEKGIGSEASLKTEYMTYFDQIKTYLEKRTQVRREEAQLEQEAQDESIINADRVRIKGQIVPKAEISQRLLSGMKVSRYRAEVNQFASRGYDHAEVLNSGPGSSRVLSLLFGPVDMYVTCLYGVKAFSYNKAIEQFCHQSKQDLVGWTKRIQIILPKEGHEEEYWEDVVNLLEKPELDDGCRHVWTKDKCFLILTRVHPSEFNRDCFPLVSIDITEILPTEVRWMVISIGGMCSKNRLIPLGMPRGFGRNLFEQRISNLPEGGKYPREESALDILSLPVLITPSMTIDFKYFDDEIRRRFESICEETLSSQPGALPYKTILKDRKTQRTRAPRRVASLPEEDLIREFWN